MDIYDFIDSKAVRDHLRKIKYKFSPIDMVRIVYLSSKALYHKILAYESIRFAHPFVYYNDTLLSELLDGIIYETEKALGMLDPEYGGIYIEDQYYRNMEDVVRYSSGRGIVECNIYNFHKGVITVLINNDGDVCRIKSMGKDFKIDKYLLNWPLTCFGEKPPKMPLPFMEGDLVDVIYNNCLGTGIVVTSSSKGCFYVSYIEEKYRLNGRFKGIVRSYVNEKNSAYKYKTNSSEDAMDELFYKPIENEYLFYCDYADITDSSFLYLCNYKSSMKEIHDLDEVRRAYGICEKKLQEQLEKLSPISLNFR